VAASEYNNIQISKCLKLRNMLKFFIGSSLLYLCGSKVTALASNNLLSFTNASTNAFSFFLVPNVLNMYGYHIKYCMSV